MGRRNIVSLVWVACSLGLFIDGYDLYISSFSEPFIQQLYRPKPIMLGILQASALMGMIFGAMIIGRLSDAVGRKRLLIFNLVFFIVIVLLSALAWNIMSLLIFRFLIGFGIGADYPLVAAYLAEVAPRNRRAKMLATAMFVNCLASPVGAFVAWGIVSVDHSAQAWRFILASGAVPAIAALLLRAQLPESFLWLAHKKIKRNFLAHYQQLFSNNLAKVTLGMGLCWFLMDISYYGIALFTPELLQSLHLGNASKNNLGGVLAVNLFVSLGALCSIFVVNKIRLIRLQKFGFLMSAISLFILSFSNIGTYKIDMTLILTGFICYNFFINFGPGMTTYILPVQYYGTDIRATGHGFVSAFAKFGACCGAIFLPVLQARVGIYYMAAILALTLLLGYVLSALISEKKGGVVAQVSLGAL